MKLPPPNYPFARLCWVAVFFVAGLPCCFSQGVLNITFDGLPTQPPSTQYYVQQYSESGIWFRPLGIVGPGNGFSRNGGGISGYPDNGTAYLQAGLVDSLQFSFINGQIFDLNQIDLAGYSDVVPNFAVHFIGYHPDGSTVTTDFSGNGIAFQTFNFGSGFSNLQRVEIPSIAWSLDNLVLTPTPEPATVWLGLLGGGVLFFIRRIRNW